MASNKLTNGVIAALWFRVQVDRRIIGLNSFADLISRWRTGERQRLDDAIEKIFADNPQATMLIDPHQEEEGDLRFMEQTMAASLIVALNACVENLAIGVCQFLLIELKKKPHWEDAVKGINTKCKIDIESLPGGRTVKQVRFLSNAFKHNDGCVNNELHQLTGQQIGDPIQYEKEDYRALISGVSDFLGVLGDAISACE